MRLWNCIENIFLPLRYFGIERELEEIEYELALGSLQRAQSSCRLISPRITVSQRNTGQMLGVDNVTGEWEEFVKYT